MGVRSKTGCGLRRDSRMWSSLDLKLWFAGCPLDSCLLSHGRRFAVGIPIIKNGQFLFLVLAVRSGNIR